MYGPYGVGTAMYEQLQRQSRELEEGGGLSEWGSCSRRCCVSGHREAPRAQARVSLFFFFIE